MRLVEIGLVRPAISASGVRVISPRCSPTSTPDTPSASDVSAATPSFVASNRSNAVGGAHHMTEDSGSQFEADHAAVLLEMGKNMRGILLDALRDHDNRVGLAALIGCAQPLRDLEGRHLELRRRDDFRAARKSGHHGEIATVAPHGLDQKRACV